MTSLLSAWLKEYERRACDAKTAQRRADYNNIAGQLLIILLEQRNTRAA